jgi:hypothetical protein
MSRHHFFNLIFPQLSIMVSDRLSDVPVQGFAGAGCKFRFQLAVRLFRFRYPDKSPVRHVRRKTVCLSDRGASRIVFVPHDLVGRRGSLWSDNVA